MSVRTTSWAYTGDSRTACTRLARLPHTHVYTQVLIRTVYGHSLCLHNPKYTFILQTAGGVSKLVLSLNIAEPQVYSNMAFVNIFIVWLFSFFAEFLLTLENFFLRTSANSLRKLFSTHIQGDGWRIAVGKCLNICTKLFKISN